MIFITTPTLKILKERLIKRNKDSMDVINTRVKNAKKELTYLPRYDYLVLNDRSHDERRRHSGLDNEAGRRRS